MSNSSTQAIPIGEVNTPYGRYTILVTRYASGDAIAILLQDSDGEANAVFSVNLVSYGALLDPDCFHVKTWSENEPLVKPMLETGLFETTSAFASTGYCVAPVWRLRNPSMVPMRRSQTH
jgi:hypothetical protein